MSGITVTGGIQGLGGFTVVQPEYFSPILLFQSNENGAWYDPSDYATMFQDNRGTTPVTAAGQSVGMILDKSRGLVIGPEMVTNGNFSTDTDWSKQAGWTIGGGVASCASTGFNSISQSAPWLVEGQTYIISFEIVSYTSGMVSMQVGTSGGSSITTGAKNAVGVYTAIGVFPVGANKSVLCRDENGFTGSIDNISVKLLPGNHATQTTAAQRPILGRNPITGTRNRLTYTEQFDNAAWAKLNSSVVANAAMAPDGTFTADSIVENSTNTQHNVYQSISTLSTTEYTASCYMKAATRTVGTINVVQNNTNYAVGVFGLSGSGTATSYGSAFTSITSEMQALSNGWYRCILKFTTPVNTGGANFIRISPSDSGGGGGGSQGAPSYPGNGSSGIYVWGAQLEIGPTLTPYQRVVSQYDVTEAGVTDAYYLAFDGSDDNLVTNSVNFTSTTAMSVFSGVTKTTNSGVIVELSANYTTNSGDFTLQSSPGYTYGSNTADAAVGGFVAPVTSVVTGLSSITNDISITRVNGTQLALSSADQGAGSYGNYPIYIGRRGGSTLPFKGRIYALIIRGANTTNPAQVEAWINERTGAYTEGQYALSLDFVSQQYTTETII